MTDGNQPTTKRRQSRRALLAMAAVAGAAAGAKVLTAPEAEAANVGIGGNIRLGVTDVFTGNVSTNLIGDVNGQFIQFWNNSSSPFAPAFVGLGRSQGLYGTISPAPIDSRFSGNKIGVAAQGGAYGVFAVAKATNGAAVYGESDKGNAVHGKSTTSGGSGIVGEAVTAYGVFGRSDSGTGVRGETNSGMGVEGVGNPGVLGTSNVGAGVSGTGQPGVEGTSSTGSGVHGETTSGTGVEASVAGGGTGIALHARGQVRFDTAGSDKFTAGQASQVVFGVLPPPGSKILVTLNQNPGPGNALKFVKRTSDTGFTVFLLKPVGGTVSFSYFVIR